MNDELIKQCYIALIQKHGIGLQPNVMMTEARRYAAEFIERMELAKDDEVEQ